jgi:hypothetical protein
MENNFSDVRVRGSLRAPVTARGFCQSCMQYQTLKVIGSGTATRLQCEACQATDAYDPRDASLI